MRVLAPIVWSEGMHLAQHHFQQQGRYFQDATAFAVATLFAKPYGLLGCEMDRDALQNGTVSMLHARGVMPDGLPFHFPHDDVPEPLEIGEIFSPTQDAHDVLLAIPPFQAGGFNCTLDPQAAANGTRYRAERVRVADETTGQDEAEVVLARKNFRLLLEGVGEPGELVSLPIARVRRDGSGRFMYDPHYVPPCLQIGASARLLELTRRLVDLLESKAEELAGRRAASAQGATELAGFWLAHSVHASLAPLRNHLEHRASHPERLFVELGRLAGALCTFGMEAHPRDLPVYDHDRPGPGFDALDRHIRAHLEVVLPTRAARIPLTQTRPSFHAAPVSDRRAFSGAAWYLGVRSNLSRADLLKRVPELVKVCSEKFIEELVRRGMAGLALEHEAAPPAAISPRPGSEYFRIITSGPCWNSITDTATVGAYVPTALSDAELELVVAQAAS